MVRLRDVGFHSKLWNGMFSSGNRLCGLFPSLSPKLELFCPVPSSLAQAPPHPSPSLQSPLSPIPSSLFAVSLTSQCQFPPQLPDLFFSSPASNHLLVEVPHHPWLSVSLSFTRPLIQSPFPCLWLLVPVSLTSSPSSSLSDLSPSSLLHPT